MSLRLPKIDKTMHLVTVEVRDTTTKRTLTGFGVISPEGQRYWQTAAIRTDAAVPLSSLAYRGLAGPTYDQTTLQLLMNKVTELCETLSG